MQRPLMLLGLSAALSACLDDGGVVDTAELDTLDGEVTAAGPASTLAAAAPAWQLPSFIPSATTTSRPAVAMDANGGAIAVWSSGLDLLASHYAPVANSWSQPIAIDSASGEPYDPLIAFDDNGRAIVVWQQTSPSGQQIWANRFVPGTGWGSAAALSAVTRSPTDLDLAVHPAGGAIVVWCAPTSTGRRVHASRLVTATGGWEPAQLVDPEDGGNAELTSVTMDGPGNAFAVWLNRKGASTTLQASRRTATGWGPPQPLVNGSYDWFLRARVVADAVGNAVAVYAIPGQGLRSRRFTPTGGWAAAQVVDPGTPDEITDLSVAGNRSGAVVAVWSRLGGQKGLSSSRFTANGGWTAVTQAFAIPTGEPSYPWAVHVTLDAAGRAHLVWEVRDGDYANVWATGGTGAWRTPQVISLSPLPTVVPVVAMGPNGAAMALWIQGRAAPHKLVIAQYK